MSTQKTYTEETVRINTFVGYSPGVERQVNKSKEVHRTIKRHKIKVLNFSITM